MKADILRGKFLDFFKSKKHKIIDSDSLVPVGDPSVLFTPAGMNQFKKEFLGLGRPLKRAATSQRCLRTDDLDKVGKTSDHHTFFEMLGNFSFGNYFKEEAISWAWEFLTAVLKIEKKQLWVSVYEGDQETYDIWKGKIGISKGKILRLGDKENFWPSDAKLKGPNGPCGPCSEIFFDLGANVGCKRIDCSPACDCSRYVEVWNLVFTQFNRKDKGVLQPLPRKNIDTGMGLERLAAIMQGVKTNFETDLFKPLTKEIDAVAKSSMPARKTTYAIADHIRAITFAIFDGVMPSNEGRGYVVRKLIRRGSMHLSLLKIRHPFLNSLVPVVAEVMKGPYPELRKQQEDIAGIIKAEEENFLSILDSAPAILERVFSNFQGKHPERLVFDLYDTYGLPVEVCCEYLNSKGLKFNQDMFNRLMDSQRERSKAASSMKGDVFNLEQLPVKVKKTRFVGDKYNQVSAKVLAILQDNKEVKRVSPGEEVSIILDETVFYPESGGQDADQGVIKKSKNIFKVEDTRRINGKILHIGKLGSGTIKKNDTVRALIDFPRRLDITRNHTATHILQAVLREVLGVHVKQKGSLVASGYLRFDFTHLKPLGRDELLRVEELVNAHILDNDKTTKKIMSIQQAKKLGALAFFEDKYHDKVRVISIGEHSKELCGGTHLDSTGQIGLFKILSESSIASGVRRIEAVTGRYAYEEVRKQGDLLNRIAEQLKVPQHEVSRKIEKILNEIKDLQKQKADIRTGQLSVSIEDILKAPQDFAGIKLIMHIIPDAEDATLRSLIDLIKQKLPMSVSLLATKKQKKAMLVMGIAADLVKSGKFKAYDLLKKVTQTMNGSGGGRADFACGAGDIDKIEAGFAKLKELISNMQQQVKP
ncbi:MAG: alanine--tRNA ligase [Candidatus Omnitrophota bacterium]